MPRRKEKPPEIADEESRQLEQLGPPPWNFVPRPYQVQCFTAFDSGIRRQFHVWHRRAGKDSTALALSAAGSHREIGSYWHLFPQQTQARRAIWHGINRDGIKFVDQAFPHVVRAKTRDQEMMIELKRGSTWQMAGSDNYNSLVGSNVRGCVFSEWALCDPNAWPYIMPILRENGGWAIFITTFRGFNHAHRMFQSVRENPEWLCSLLTINDTQHHDGRPILTAKDIEAERRDGMPEARIREEYYCEPQRAAAGSYYGRVMQWLEAEQRLGAAGYESTLPLYSAWHVAADALACILVQPRGTEARIVASRSWRFTTVADALEELREQIPFARHLRACIVRSKCARPFELAGYECEEVLTPDLTDGIETVRRFLPTVRIDTERRPFAPDGNNVTLLDSLAGFRAEESEHEGMFQEKPAKTWETFLAEAVQTYAVFHDQGGTLGWSRAPNYAQRDRGVI